MQKTIIILAILLVLGLVFAGTFLFSGVASVDAGGKPGNCPPECKYGCYLSGECCPKPDPGQPPCGL